MYEKKKSFYPRFFGLIYPGGSAVPMFLHIAAKPTRSCRRWAERPGLLEMLGAGVTTCCGVFDMWAME